MSLIESIYTNMASDDEDDSERLATLYANATPDQKKVLDDALICICGYTLSRLISMNP